MSPVEDNKMYVLTANAEQVVLQFEKECTWFMLTPEDAEELVKKILSAVDKIKQTKG